MKPLVLVTVRPGPMMHVWQGGQEVARVPLDLCGALTLAADLLAATARAQADADRGGRQFSGQGGAVRPARIRTRRFFSTYEKGGCLHLWGVCSGTDAGTFLAPKPAPDEKTGE